MLLEESVDEGGKHKLRVLAVVGHASLEGESVVGFVYQRHEDRVDAGGVGVETQKVSFAVESLFGRCGDVDQKVFEVNVGGGLQKVGHGIALLTADIETSYGQQFLKHVGVDDALSHLCVDAVAQGGQLVGQPAIGTAGIHLDDQGATLSTDVCGVGVGFQ